MATLRDGYFKTVEQLAGALGLTVSGYHTVVIRISSSDARLLSAINWLLTDRRDCFFDYSTAAPTQDEIDQYHLYGFEPKTATFWITNSNVCLEFKLLYG